MICVLEIVVRIDGSDQLLRNEVTSIIFNRHLHSNVAASAYFVQVKVQLVLERIHRLRKYNVLRQIFPWGRHSVKKKVCSRIVFTCSPSRHPKRVSSL